MNPIDLDALAAAGHPAPRRAGVPAGYAQRWDALVAISVPVIVGGIDGTLLLVALPTIGRELGTNASQLIWIKAAYLIVFGSTLLLGASLCHKLGCKRLLIIGMGIFAVGSIGSGIAGMIENTALLIGARIVQGFGAGAMSPSVWSIIRALFVEERERNRAIGIQAGLNGLGLAIGPLVGGVILTVTPAWSWIFYVTVPIIAVGIVLIGLWVREQEAEGPRPIDASGCALSLVGLLAVFYGIIETPTRGWTQPDVLGAMILGLGLLTLYGFYELRRDQPQLDPRLFRRAPFVAGVAVLAISFFAMLGLVYKLTLYLQDVRDYSALRAGAALTPIALMLFVVAPIAPRLVERRGARETVVIGLLLQTAGLLAFLATTMSSGYGVVLIGLLLVGVGVALVQPPASAAILSAVSVEEAGMACGVNSAIRKIGGSAGVAVLGGAIGHTAFSDHLAGSSAFQALPSDAQHAARGSISAAVQLARRTGEHPGATSAETAGHVSNSLLDAVTTAFVNGLHLAVIVAAVATLVGVVVAARTFPTRTATAGAQREP